MRFGLKNISVLLALSTMLATLLFIGCNKETVIPPNPYDDIVYPTPPAPIDTLDPNNIVAIHKDILRPRCSVPGCHDGSFEPDFRTVQSSTSTMVYAPIIKNNADSTFIYRVIPNDTANLYFTNE